MVSGRLSQERPEVSRKRRIRQGGLLFLLALQRADESGVPGYRGRITAVTGRGRKAAARGGARGGQQRARLRRQLRDENVGGAVGGERGRAEGGRAPQFAGGVDGG